MSIYAIEFKFDKLDEEFFSFFLNRLTFSDDEKVIARLRANVLRILNKRYLTNDHYYFDNNAVIGWDEDFNSWYVHAFEMTLEDDSVVFFLHLGLLPNEVSDINSIFFYFNHYNISVYMYESDLKELVNECKSLGNPLTDFSPFVYHSFEEHIRNPFLFACKTNHFHNKVVIRHRESIPSHNLNEYTIDSSIDIKDYLVLDEYRKLDRKDFSDLSFKLFGKLSKDERNSQILFLPSFKCKSFCYTLDSYDKKHSVRELFLERINYIHDTFGDISLLLFSINDDNVINKYFKHGFFPVSRIPDLFSFFEFYLVRNYFVSLKYGFVIFIHIFDDYKTNRHIPHFYLFFLNKPYDTVKRVNGKLQFSSVRDSYSDIISKLLLKSVYSDQGTNSS